MEQYEHIELSIRQLITLLNLVADDHISCNRALALLQAVGVTPSSQRTSDATSPPHARGSTTPRPSKEARSRSPPKASEDDDVSALVSRFQQSASMAGPSSSRKGKTPIKSSAIARNPPPPAGAVPHPAHPLGVDKDARTKSSAEKRWYCVTAGEVVGAVYSWSVNLQTWFNICSTTRQVQCSRRDVSGAWPVPEQSSRP
jgi:hypothetical protein